MRRTARVLIVLALAAGGVVPLAGPAPSARAATAPRFVYETLAPTPKADANQVWLTNVNPVASFTPCGDYAVTFRIATPTSLAAGSKFLVNLRHNVRPWGGGFPPYSLIVRTDSAAGPIAYEGPLQTGNTYVDLTAALTPAHLAQGYVDLKPTITCTRTNEGWTWHADSDWGYWDVEAYLIGPTVHTLPHLTDAVVYYRYGFPRLLDLAKYDLVILAATYPEFADELAILKKRGATVAAYISFGLEKRCSPKEPLLGDRAGPGGYDSRYTDFFNAAGAKISDGFPDSTGESTSCRWYRTDPRSASWQRVLLSQANVHVANGANALFLDGFEMLHPSLAPGFAAAVGALKAAHPDVHVVVNSYQGFFEAGDLIDGVMMESFTYAPGGIRLDPSLDPIRDDQARDANFLRDHPAKPRFSLFTLDAIEPYSASDKVDVAFARAASNGMQVATWDMVLVNPAYGLKKSPVGKGFKLTWKVYPDTPAPETMSSLAWYEIRRSAKPFSGNAAWNAATVVATGLGPGARAFTDLAAPASGAVYYALRAYRTGPSGRLLIGTLKVKAR